MLAFKREGRGPFRHWGLLLCLPQTEKKEEKPRRKPRDEEEQLHAEVELNEHFPDSVQPDVWRKRRSLVLTPLLATEWVNDQRCDCSWYQIFLSDLPWRCTFHIQVCGCSYSQIYLSDLLFIYTFQMYLQDLPSSRWGLIEQSVFVLCRSLSWR